MPGQDCKGDSGVSDCPYHVFRTSDDIYNHWENVVNNINSVTPYLTQADASIPPRSRPGAWGYPDMLETANLGCATATNGVKGSCVAKGPPTEDRSQFGMWCIVSSPLVLSFDLTNKPAVDRVWPILSNKEAIAVNQHWNGSPGQLLLTDKVTYPSPLNAKGYYEYPGQLGQSRGWKDVPGINPSYPGSDTGCVDEWTGGNCTQHYMTLGWGPMKMTVDAADTWCTGNSSCHGFTFKSLEHLLDPTAETDIYFRDETQIFFMDSEISHLNRVDKPKWTSHISKERAPPISKPECDKDPFYNYTVCTSGLQIWVKDVGSDVTGSALALLLVNHGSSELESYSLPVRSQPLSAAAFWIMSMVFGLICGDWKLNRAAEQAAELLQAEQQRSQGAGRLGSEGSGWRGCEREPGV